MRTLNLSGRSIGCVGWGDAPIQPNEISLSIRLCAGVRTTIKEELENRGFQYSVLTYVRSVIANRIKDMETFIEVTT